MKTKYAMRLAYDGTDFCGWQTQRGKGRHVNPKQAIEETLVSAILDLCDETVTVTGSGRTDAGVHAVGQVAHFRLETDRFSIENLRRGLNHRLPESVQILQLGKVPAAFHSQRTLSKQYSYYFQEGPAILPHLRKYTTWCRNRLDGEAMHGAIQALIGTHDFAAFSRSGVAVSSTVREITEAEVTCEGGGFPMACHAAECKVWRVRLVGSGFLKQMVRTIAGTLKEIGEGSRPAFSLATTLESRDRDASGPTAPAGGLWLERVMYPVQEGIAFLMEDSESKQG